MKAIRAQNKCC